MMESDACITELLRPEIIKNTDIIQHAEAVCKSYIQSTAPDPEFILDKKTFQNPALVIAILNQMRNEHPSIRLNQKRLSIINAYVNSDIRGQSKYTVTVAPYLDEYLRLEQSWHDIVKGINVPDIRNKDSVAKEVNTLLCGDNPVAIPRRLARLESLAITSPDAVLMAIMEHLDVSSEELSPDQLDVWMSVLAPEGSGTQTNVIAFPLFEIICRLLYQTKPDQLLSFVRIAQIIHDKSVGVSAFIRKRQTFQFYVRALSCIPSRPDKSHDIGEAVKSRAELLLSVNTPHSALSALQYLCRYDQWEMGLTLLREHMDPPLIHQQLYMQLVKAMADKHVLSLYSHEVFQLIPEKMSLLSLIPLIGSQDPHKLGNHPIKSKDIFCTSDSDVSIGQVQQVFQNLLDTGS